MAMHSESSLIKTLLKIKVPKEDFWSDTMEQPSFYLHFLDPK